MKYKHLNLTERTLLCRYRIEGLSQAEIGRRLGRDKSTIHRETKRNTHHNGDRSYYTFSKADEKANGRKRRSQRNQRITDEDFKPIKEKIQQQWSPMQIVNTLALKGKKTISHETIYQRIELDKKQGGTLYKHLRHQRKLRRKRYGARDRRGQLVGKTMIADRPAHINLRKEVGDWEMDTVMGTGSKHCLVTLTERRTGLSLIGIMTNKTAAQTTASLIRLIHENPTVPFKTITADNGTEFHSYKEIEKVCGLKVYFANPYHSWERGTNENTNGLIRQYIPKGRSMARITQEEVDTIARSLNTRPRKRLGWKTPINQLLLDAASVALQT